MDVIEYISKIGIVPVVKINDADYAQDLALALIEGGLPCAEITFRTSAAADAIRSMNKKFPHMCIGAGTVLSIAQVDEAVAAGAKFIVSPGFNPKVVEYCISKNIPIIPGISTPSEIEQAMEYGLKTVKFFPAEQSGGLAKIKAMSAPYSSMRFMPTGGINASNLNSYLDFEKIVACGGSWMVPSDLLAAKEFDKIRDIVRQAVHTMLGFELAHIGINEENEDLARKTAQRFSLLFGLPYKDGNSSIFAGSAVEVMKTPYLGSKGHIAIRTNYMDRAINYLNSVLGVEFNTQSAKKDEKSGKIKAIYLKEEIGGFAVHLLQK